MTTYSQIFIHIVFAVKGRQSLIKEEWETPLYKYISGIIQNRGHKMLAINGMPDHIHIFFGMKPNDNISDLVREVKKSSSAYIKLNKYTPYNFYWQEGFGAFSYGQSQISSVCNYIENQKNIHRKRKFREEYINLLTKYEIEYKDEYLFEWLE